MVHPALLSEENVHDFLRGTGEFETHSTGRGTAVTMYLAMSLGTIAFFFVICLLFFFVFVFVLSLIYTFYLCYLCCFLYFYILCLGGCLRNTMEYEGFGIHLSENFFLDLAINSQCLKKLSMACLPTLFLTENFGKNYLLFSSFIFI